MEDVQFLKQSAKEESFLFVIDSSKRDKHAFPSPSEYTIQFNAPFKNVIGLELLDAAIPRTEYVVDEAFNTLVYTVNNGPKKTATVPPGDYNLLQLCQTLSELLEDGLAVEPVSSPYAQTSKLKFTCAQPFTLYLTESTMRRQLGFAGTEKTYSSDVVNDAIERRVFLGPYPGYDIYTISGNAALRQAFIPTLSGPVFGVTLYIDTETSTPVSVRIVDGAGTVYGTTTIDPSATSKGVVEDAEGSLIAGETYYMIMEAANGADIFVNAPTDTSNPAEVRITPASEWQEIPDGNSVACDVWVSTGRHELVSPHLVDLTGVRYVMVRCPEIETYLYRERAYEPWYAGLGMVKLGGNGVREQRFDFVSFPSRSLTTPLGKLSSLTIRLEKPDGTLYNSRGIDHALILVLRYYSGIKSQPAPPILNQEYNPQALQFLEHTTWKREVDARDTLRAWQR